MLRAIEIRLYPNAEQQKLLNYLFGSYRFVYNQCLNYKKSSYKFDGTNIRRFDLVNYFHHNLRVEFEWLKKQNTKILGQAIINMLSAYDSFFVQHKGFPKFKNKYSHQAARFPKEAISVNTFDEENCRLKQEEKIFRR
jgi:putative transposase